MEEYALTKEGIAAFMGDVVDDVMDNGIYDPIQIIIGCRTISATLFPETYEALETMLKESQQIIEEEYSDAEN